MSSEHRCEACFGRGYKGGGRLPTCRTCDGRGSLTFDSVEAREKHVKRWARHWKRAAEKAR